MLNKQEIINHCTEKAALAIHCLASDYLLDKHTSNCEETGDRHRADNDNNNSLIFAKDRITNDFEETNYDYEIIPFFEEEDPTFFKLVKSKIMTQVNSM